jgi:hypothetical protein
MSAPRRYQGHNGRQTASPDKMSTRLACALMWFSGTWLPRGTGTGAASRSVRSPRGGDCWSTETLCDVNSLAASVALKTVWNKNHETVWNPNNHGGLTQVS